MRWDAVLAAVQAAVLGDTILTGIYAAGGGVRLASSTAEHVVPVLELSLIADAEDELWAPCTIQWDQWTERLEDLVASERQLRRHFHADLPVTIAGVTMWVQYVDGDVLASPDRDGYHGRAIRFRCTPLRELYAGTP